MYSQLRRSLDLNKLVESPSYGSKVFAADRGVVVSLPSSARIKDHALRIDGGPLLPA